MNAQRTALALLALLLATLGMRCWQLERRDFWLDEAYSVWNASGARPGRLARSDTPFTRQDWAPSSDLGEVFASIRETENTPPLYFLVLRGWMALVGRSEAAVRGLSVLAGTLTVLALFLAARSLAGPRAAWTAAWLLALWPMHVYYSREGRNYALAALFAVGLLHALLRARHETLAGRPATRWWLLYTAAAVAGLYTNYLFGLLLAAHGAVLAGVALRERLQVRRCGRVEEEDHASDSASVSPHVHTPTRPHVRTPIPPHVHTPTRPRVHTSTRPHLHTFRPWLLASLAAGLLFVPWVVYAVGAQAEEALAFTHPDWLVRAVRFWTKLLFYLFVGETSLKTVFLQLPFLSLPLVALLGVAAFGLLRPGGGPARALGLIPPASAGLYLVGLLLACLASGTWLLVSPRFAVFILPWLCLALAVGMERVRDAAVRGQGSGVRAESTTSTSTSTAVQISASSSSSVIRTLTPHLGTLLCLLYAGLLLSPASAIAARPSEEWRRAAALILREGRPGDLVLFDGGLGAIAFNLYYRGALPQLPVAPVRERALRAAAEVRRHDRLWLVQSYARVDEAALGPVLEGFTGARAIPCGPALQIQVLSRRPVPSLDR